MPKKEVVSRKKESYKSLSDEDLINALHSAESNKTRHIAAKQEIESRKRAFGLQQLTIDKSTNILTKYILALTIVLLVIASVQLSYSFGIFSFNDIVSVNSETTIKNTQKAKNTNNIQ